MIQRIQTVYLLIVAILSIVLMSSTIGRFIAPDNSIVEMTNLALINQEGAENYEPWALFAAIMFSTIISLATVFMFRKRMLQIRLTIFNIILEICYYGILVIFVIALKGNSSFTPAWPVCLPFVNIVFNWLAIRAIGKDEVLVRAYDRLR